MARSPPQDTALQKTWKVATISVACPIVSPLRGSKRGKPSATKPMVLRRLLRNRTASSAGLSVKSRRLSAVTRATGIEIGAIFLPACTIDERLLGRPEDLYDFARTPPAMDRQRLARQHRTRRA